jgi:hypothetical protein
MFYEGDYKFFTSIRIELLLDVNKEPSRRNRYSNQQHPKVYKTFVCSPPWRSIAPQYQKCFKAI